MIHQPYRKGRCVRAVRAIVLNNLAMLGIRQGINRDERQRMIHDAADIIHHGCRVRYAADIITTNIKEKQYEQQRKQQ